MRVRKQKINIMFVHEEGVRIYRNIMRKGHLGVITNTYVYNIYMYMYVYTCTYVL